MATEDALNTASPPSSAPDAGRSGIRVPGWVGWLSGLGPLGFATVYREGRKRGIQIGSAVDHPDVTRFWKKMFGLWAITLLFVLAFGLTYGAGSHYVDLDEIADASPGTVAARDQADDALLEAGLYGLAALALAPLAVFAVARMGSLTFRHGVVIGQRVSKRAADWSAMDWWRRLRTRMSPRSASAIVLWRIQVTFDGALAIFLIETIGRWPAAWTMGLVFAVFSAVYLFLLDGERAMHELSHWLRERTFIRRFILPIQERNDRTGTALRMLAIPYTIMLMAPFFRAVTFHSLKVPRAPAYGISILGSIPHQLFWVGIVLGSLWAIALKPGLQRLWDEAIEPFLDWLWYESLEPALLAPCDAVLAVADLIV